MILKALKNNLRSIGKTLDKPIFIKDYENCEEVINQLEELKAKISDKNVKESIELDQLLIKQGSIGEQNVYYEIKNSFIPMYVLHNISIEHEDYKAQIDFVLITKHFIMILETKKLVGDIQINNQGEFIRTIRNKDGKFVKKEGMYSPISQNARHVRILQDLLLKEKIIKNTPVLSLVVIANPKSIIDFKFAPKELKDQIVKYDQLTPYIKKKIDKISTVDLSILTMQDIAGFIISRHIDQENTFLDKYQEYINENTAEMLSQQTATEVIVEAETDITKVREELINFRKQQAKAENIAAYYIFNNAQMEDLLSKHPKTKEDLLKCSGFNQAKVDKYGESILGIINLAI